MAKQNIQQVKQRFGIIGVSPELERAIDIALQVAPTDLSVLITGESGVGKENFPQIIHQYSRRKHGPYFAINCGSIPEGTIDSELFGHEKGAFTGATAERKGYFEVANGGTLFLDEVGELPLSTQARLLRVLETGEFIKVGSSQVEKSDVRVVAATNLNITKAMEKGKFREDLYYRLNTVPIKIIPLRERKDDIYLLFRKFASDSAEKYMMPAISLTDEAREMLREYHWPGNIRQLKNITEQISVIEHERVITPEILDKFLPKRGNDLLPVLASQTREAEQRSFSSEREIMYQVLFDMKKDINDLKLVVRNLIENASDTRHDDKQTISETVVLPQDNTRVNLPIRLDDSNDITNISKNEPSDFQEETEIEASNLSLEEVEKEMIIKVLEKHSGKRKKAAQELGISERTLYRKIKDYKIDNL